MRATTVFDQSERTWSGPASLLAEGPSRLKIEERQIDDVSVLVLRGDIVLDDGDLALRKHVHDLVAEGRVKIVLDLAGVTHIDSSGVGMIVAKQQMVRASGGDMKLLRLTPRNERVLATMKVLTIFQLFDDEASAVRSFSRH
jgi:anti-sigma B factor antagonist